MKRNTLITICFIIILLLSGCTGFSEKTVGKDIAIEDISEFYYTYATSTYPPDYQRYLFYVDNGTSMFYHEKREGDHWPLSEDDITISGSIELSEEEWSYFFSLLKDGKVKKRSESADSGRSGPWLYLYWNGDRSKYQEFSFASWDAEVSFEEFCVELKNLQ